MSRPAPMKPAIDKTEVHIALDIETLGLNADSVVMSIGMVAFTLIGGEVGSTFLLPSQDEQRQFGRKVEPNTAKWWNQPEQAQARLQFDGQQLPITTIRGLIYTFINKFETKMTTVAGIWGFGSDFDNAAIHSLCTMHGESAPWSYKKNRCGRTLVNMVPWAQQPNAVGNKHHALDDARFQAEWFRRCLLELNARMKV